MGFLHKLWDETLAGPMPDAGLGKLRKYDSFPARSTPNIPDGVSITRSITVVRRNNNHPSFPGSSQESPSLSGTPSPRTPFSPGTPPGYYRGSSGRKSSVAAADHAEPIKKSELDWVVMNALDR